MGTNLSCLAAILVIASGCQNILGIEDVEGRADASGGTGPGTSADASGTGSGGGADASIGEDARPSDTEIEWVEFSGGTFLRGSDDDDASLNESPVHEVELSAFSLAETETSVAQYEACVDAGECDEPSTGGSCNWGISDRDNHPINCVSWFDAQDFCEFVDGRLPTEAEREYAATSGGRDWKFPWGDEDATCERAVMSDAGENGCGEDGTWPVCSKPAGHSEQGICDLAGNVWEWVYDWHGDYEEGSHVDPKGPESGSDRVLRGGSGNVVARHLRASNRAYGDPSASYGDLGFRCARSP